MVFLGLGRSRINLQLISNQCESLQKDEWEPVSGTGFDKGSLRLPLTSRSVVLGCTIWKTPALNFFFPKLAS